MTARYKLRRLIDFSKFKRRISTGDDVEIWLHSAFSSDFSAKKMLFSALLLLIVPFAVAQAGFFTFWSDVFTKANIVEKQVNSQNIALLAAVGGPDLEDQVADNDVNTVNGSALLPESGPLGGLADLSEGYDHGQISIYVVREGDSFSSIASMFNVSINTIIWANDLARGSKLTVGQTLVILPVSGVQHVVKKGDTLASIAKKYKADIGEIAKYNGLDEVDALAVGTVVIVPDGEIATVQPAPVRPAASTKLRNAGGPIYDNYYAAPLPSGYRRTQGLHGYNGIDLGLYRGAPVFAAAGGEVIIARASGYNGGYGKYVVVRHANGTQTLYGHLDSVTVASGEVVFSGQQVGTLGNTGRSTGPHLHFEVRGAKNPF
jgi:LysM repeat protein